jgi:PrcB C-terminal
MAELAAMRKWLFVLAMPLLTPCTTTAQGEKVLLGPEDRARHLSQPGMEGPPEPSQLVLRTAVEWDSVWQVLNRNRVEPPALPAPAVDFAHEMVLLAGLGRQASSGWNIRIDSVVMRRDTLRAIIHSLAPQCMAGMVITYPWDAVRVPRSDAVVQFVKRPIIDWCR